MTSEESVLPNDEAFRLAYNELRKLAYRVARGHDNQTLNPTALVHEAYIKLAKAENLRIESLQHLKCMVVRAMRHILLDNARRRAASSRGGQRGDQRGSEQDLNSVAAMERDPCHLIALDQALEKLALEDKTQVQLFELQYFGGMTAAEMAELLSMSEKTVQRKLRRARAYLADALFDRRSLAAGAEL